MTSKYYNKNDLGNAKGPVGNVSKVLWKYLMFSFLNSLFSAWLNNCVGHFNHRYFFSFCVSLTLGCMYCSISGRNLFIDAYNTIDVRIYFSTFTYVWFIIYYFLATYYKLLLSGHNFFCADSEKWIRCFVSLFIKVFVFSFLMLVCLISYICSQVCVCGHVLTVSCLSAIAIQAHGSRETGGPGDRDWVAHWYCTIRICCWEGIGDHSCFCGFCR